MFTEAETIVSDTAPPQAPYRYSSSKVLGGLVLGLDAGGLGLSVVQGVGLTVVNFATGLGV